MVRGGSGHRWLLITGAVIAITGCSGGSSETGQATIDDQVVIDPDQVAAARERAENEAEPATVATAPTSENGPVETTGTSTGDAPRETTATTIAVAEADEDELDSLLNSLTVFNQCLTADGFEFIGAPGIAGATADQFEEPYLASLGKCATSSDVVDALQNFGAAQENRTPEEIAAFNFGLPVFRDCMIALGWNVGELVPDEKGALGFGNLLEPPPGTEGFGTDDVSGCRLEAEQYVADNYDPDA